MPERSDAPLDDEPRAGATPGDAPPSGLPEGADEATPLGTDDDDAATPEGEGETARGEQAQPGLNREEPDVSG